MFAAVREAHDRLGGLDVVVNNAGYGVSGAIQELTEEQARRQIEVNLFGALWVTQAALPLLRKQGSGWIVQVSSIGGLAAFPLTGIYHASKGAWRASPRRCGRSSSRSGSRTDGRAERFSDRLGGIVHGPRRAHRCLPGDRDDRQALLETLDRDDPPFRLLLGNVAYDVAVDRYQSRLEGFRAGERVARGADDR
ncbi:MAG TPA: SDR family NAD(P)-dependent oxidoreductase [Solirubrobacteraceae bacterium]|nr:SDR family NAD(P)-dependent oxidoreductase [Solirubrobacteraceae bacterium]